MHITALSMVRADIFTLNNKLKIGDFYGKKEISQKSEEKISLLLLLQVDQFSKEEV